MHSKNDACRDYPADSRQLNFDVWKLLKLNLEIIDAFKFVLLKYPKSLMFIFERVKSILLLVINRIVSSKFQPNPTRLLTSDLTHYDINVL